MHHYALLGVLTVANALGVYETPKEPWTPKTVDVPPIVEQAPKVRPIAQESVPLPLPRPKDAVSEVPEMSAEDVSSDLVYADLCERYRAAKKFDAGEDFTWKDFAAALRAGYFHILLHPERICEYTISRLEPSFRRKLYNACQAASAAGFECGITSGFRDDWRQLIAKGKKAASEWSYHGGSKRGGYGRAADVVDLKGNTAGLYAWIDKNGKEFGVGRPYRDKDPPHVTPMDSPEYIAKRGKPSNQPHTATKKPKRHKVASQ